MSHTTNDRKRHWSLFLIVLVLLVCMLNPKVGSAADWAGGQSIANEPSGEKIFQAVVFISDKDGYHIAWGCALNIYAGKALGFELLEDSHIVNDDSNPHASAVVKLGHARPACNTYGRDGLSRLTWAVNPNEDGDEMLTRPMQRRTVGRVGMPRVRLRIDAKKGWVAAFRGPFLIR
ncbi:MAG: hypothetical protein AAGC72_07700 [Planctomycetota bacterium]